MPDTAVADTPSHDRPTSTPTSATNKRPRPVISCLECRRKKLKCDRTHPCLQCLKIGRPGRCEYQAGQEPELNIAYSLTVGPANKRPRLEQEALATVVDNASESGMRDSHDHDHSEPQRLVPAPAPSGTGVIEALQERVARLEQALLSHGQRPQGQPQPTDQFQKNIPESPRDHPPSNRFDPQRGDDSAFKSRTDLRFPEAVSFLQKLQTNSSSSEILDLRTELRYLQHVIETIGHKRHYRTFLPATAALHHLDLPPYHVCERLAIHYFDNMEHCFRILHWPEFREQLKVYFTSGLGEKACKFGFIPQLVCVLATAATLGTHPECAAVTTYPILQSSTAFQFINGFLQSLPPRQRYLLPVLQVKMLVLMLRWMCMDAIDDLFHLSGDVLRDALVMKMDQDPSTIPGISVFQSELRRRCWMTVVECDLMLSILGKLPCMVPPYTTQQPQNVNDDELYEGMQALPPSRPLGEWTDGLCQYVLSQSFPRRLEACKQMDSCGPSHAKFQDVLLHTRYLERMLQELPPPLRFSYQGDQASKTPPRLMARMELDISIRRPLLHLYSCCASAPNADDIQQETRAGFLQSCLMLTTFQDLFDPNFSEINVPRPEGYWDFFHNVYRYELGQAILGLCLEIKRLCCADEARQRQAQRLMTYAAERADQTYSHPETPISTSTPTSQNGNTVVRPPSYTKENMIDAVRDILSPMKRRLVHPGANLKDLVYFTVVLTSVLPLEQPYQTKEAMIIHALQRLVRDCRTQLEREHAPLPSGVGDPTTGTSRSRDPGTHHSHSQAETSVRSSDVDALPLGPKFDPTWAEFPDLEFLDSPSHSGAPTEAGLDGG